MINITWLDLLYKHIYTYKNQFVSCVMLYGPKQDSNKTLHGKYIIFLNDWKLIVIVIISN